MSNFNDAQWQKSAPEPIISSAPNQLLSPITLDFNDVDAWR